MLNNNNLRTARAKRDEDDGRETTPTTNPAHQSYDPRFKRESLSAHSSYYKVFNVELSLCSIVTMSFPLLGIKMATSGDDYYTTQVKSPLIERNVTHPSSPLLSPSPVTFRLISCSRTETVNEMFEYIGNWS